MSALNIVVLALIPVLATAAYAGFSAAPWLPTRRKERDLLVAELKLQGHETLYDLGCGDGRLLFSFARKYPNLTLIGYEISLVPWLIGVARKLLFFRRYQNVSLRFGNLFRQHFTDADVVFLFLLSKAYPKILEHVWPQLKPGSKLIVEAWPIEHLPLVQTVKPERALAIYVYKKRYTEVQGTK